MPEGEIGFVCKPIFVPDVPGLWETLYGQIQEMTRDYYWREQGTMTPAQASLLWARAQALNDLDATCGSVIMACEDVADCIETSLPVQIAIIESNDQYGTTNTDYLSPAGTESTTIINNRFPSAERAAEIKDAPPDCDLDELWAGIRYMVERIDDNGRQLLERIQTKVDIWEKIIEFTGTVPIVGELAENVLKAFVGSVDDLLNAYNSHSSASAMDDIACDFFEMVCAECRYPTFQEIADYYASFGITGVQDWYNIGLKAMVDYVTGSNGLAGLVVYFTVNIFQLWVLYAEATFVNARKAKVLTIWADIGEDNPTNAWELLCDGCSNPVWCYEWDFTTSNGGFVLHNPYGIAAGEWQDGVGWVYQDKSLAGYLYRAVTLRTASFASFASNITEWYWEGDYTYGKFEIGGGNPDIAAMNAMYNSNNGIMYITTATEASIPSYSGTPIEHTKEGLKSQTGTYFWFQWYSSNDNINPVSAAGNVVIRKLRLKGTGTTPALTGGTAC